MLRLRSLRSQLFVRWLLLRIQQNILELPIVIRSNLCSNVIVTIYGDPNIGLLLVLDLYTIGIAIVPALQDFSLGELPDICVHGVSDIEAQILCSAFHQP